MLVLQLLSPIHLMFVACLGERSLLCERLMSQELYSHYSVYNLLVTSVNGYLIFSGAQGCEHEAWRAFVVVTLLAVGDGVCRNLRVRVTVLVVDGLVPDCTVMI